MPARCRAIVQLTTPTQTVCRESYVPIVDPVYLFVYAEGTAESARASRLYREVQHALGKLKSLCLWFPCREPRLVTCMNSAEPGFSAEPRCRSVLVAVLGAGPISARTTALFNDWLSLSNSALLPILPAGVTPGSVLPSHHARLGALFDVGQIELLAPDVLRAVGIGGDDYRLFISYRRSDSLNLADQLFEAFARHGFDVFLDRFRGTPGRSFPRELAEELVDKSLVLVLESANIGQSPWTLAEVAIANIFRLGLLAVSMPNSTPFSTIPASGRFVPRPGDWIGSGSEAHLTSIACDRLVDFVRQQYVRQVTYRQIYLETLLSSALAGRRLTSTIDAAGVHQVTGGGRDYSVHLSSRPPQLSDVRRVKISSRTGSHPVLVGPHGLLRPNRAVDLDWLVTEMGITQRREGEILRLATGIAAGALPP